MPFEKNSFLTTDDVDREEVAEFHHASTAIPVQVVQDEYKPDQIDPLFNTDEARDLRSRWQSIQTAFVDEPRKSVEDADRLVATAIKRLSDMFTDERSRLEAQWGRGSNVSTEELRVALQRYRTFFSRLLSV